MRRVGESSTTPVLALAENWRPVMRALASATLSGGRPGIMSTTTSRAVISPSTLSAGTACLCAARSKAAASQSTFIEADRSWPPWMFWMHQARASALMKLGHSRNKSTTALGPICRLILSVAPPGTVAVSAVAEPLTVGPRTARRSNTSRPCPA